MSIQWYPGHMAKARREILENLKHIDVVVELIDARIPASARNPDIPEIHRKPHILAVAKCDLADPACTEIWCQYWRQQREKVVLLDLINGKGINVLRKEITKYLTKQKREPRVLVVGIPNVGKSTLINRLAGAAAPRSERGPVLPGESSGLTPVALGFWTLPGFCGLSSKIRRLQRGLLLWRRSKMSF